MKLEIENLQKSFGEYRALPCLNAHIDQFQTLAFLGPSGSGKSTLLKILAGVEYPDQGKIILDGHPIIFEEPELKKHRLKLGIVFQSWNLFPHMTALENITLPLYRVHGMPKAEAETTGLELLNRFEMKEQASKKAFQLSGGQAQRVAIIRAMAIRPHLLLLDEPTSALDPLMTAEVLDMIVELKKEGTRLILVTHHFSFAKQIADWSLFFTDGAIIASGETHALLDHPPPSIKNYIEKVSLY